MKTCTDLLLDYLHKAPAKIEAKQRALTTQIEAIRSTAEAAVKQAQGRFDYEVTNFLASEAAMVRYFCKKHGFTADDMLAEPMGLSEAALAVLREMSERGSRDYIYHPDADGGEYLSAADWHQRFRHLTPVKIGIAAAKLTKDLGLPKKVGFKGKLDDYENTVTIYRREVLEEVTKGELPWC